MTEVLVRSILTQLGFVEDWHSPSDEPPAFVLNLGVVQLRAAQATSRFFRPIFLISGIVQTERELSTIHIEMPLNVESFEQGIAWIAHGIGSALPPSISPSWLEEGRRWRELLPWVRRQVGFESRPQCVVDRDWFRVAGKKLREQGDATLDDKLGVVSFDRGVLRIEANSSVVTMPAEGDAWAESYQVLLRQFRSLPQRIMKQSIFIEVWDGNLIIAGLRLPIVPIQKDDHR
jgi:hypothetical protein